MEDTPLGTAGSVKQAEEHLKDDTFLIISGDALTDIDLDKAIAFHREKTSLATIVLAHVPNPLEFGVVITDDDGRIRRFLEKPSWGEVFSDTVNTGMYILEPSIFDYMEMGKSYDWSQDIFPQMLAENKPMFGYVMDGDYWCDVGNLQQYREAQYTVMDGKTQGEDRFKLGGKPNHRSLARREAATSTRPRRSCPPVVIGQNCKIKAGAEVGPYSVIGDNAIIEEKASVHRSILWDNVYVGVESRLSACTVCSHVTDQAQLRHSGGRGHRRSLPHRGRLDHPHADQALAGQDHRGGQHRHDEPDLGPEVGGLALPQAGRDGHRQHRADAGFCLQTRAPPSAAT